MKAKLVPGDGGKPLLLSQVITVIGRNPDYCDFVISHEKISAVHCVVAQSAGLLFVRDMNSTNGTFVNGVQVARSALVPGDRLTIADFSFVLHVDHQEDFLAHDEPREVVSYIPRATQPPAPPFGGAGAKPAVTPQQSSIQVYDSFIGKVPE